MIPMTMIDLLLNFGFGELTLLVLGIFCAGSRGRFSGIAKKAGLLNKTSTITNEHVDIVISFTASC